MFTTSKYGTAWRASSLEIPPTLQSITAEGSLTQVLRTWGDFNWIPFQNSYEWPLAQFPGKSLLSLKLHEL